jgi:hypothetical protein
MADWQVTSWVLLSPCHKAGLNPWATCLKLTCQEKKNSPFESWQREQPDLQNRNGLIATLSPVPLFKKLDAAIVEEEKAKLGK